MINKAQKWDKEMYSYHWEGCLIKMKDAASGLMSIDVQHTSIFAKIVIISKSIQRHESANEL